MSFKSALSKALNRATGKGKPAKAAANARGSRSSRRIPRYGSRGTKNESVFGGDFQAEVSYDNLEYLFERDELAHKIVVKPARDCFKKDPLVRSEDEACEKETNELFANIHLFSEFAEALILQRLYGFSTLAFALRDTADISEEPAGVTGIAYVNALSARIVQDITLDENPESETYGQILEYEVEFSSDGTGQHKKVIHAQRCLHLVGDTLDNDPKGISVLKWLFDILQVKKNCDWSFGQSAFRNADPFKRVVIPDSADDDEFDKWVEEFETIGRNAFFVPSDDWKLDFYPQALINPTGFNKVIMERLSAGSGIPKTVLLGTEAGVVTGAWVNQADYFTEIAQMQKTFIEPLLRQIIERLRKWGLLKSNADFWIEWPTLWELDDREMAEANDKQASAMLRQAKALQTFVDLGFPVNIEGQQWVIGEGDNVIKAAANIRIRSPEYEAMRRKWLIKTTPLEHQFKAAMLLEFQAIEEDLIRQIERILGASQDELSAEQADLIERIIRGLKMPKTAGAATIRKYMELAREEGWVQTIEAMGATAEPFALADPQAAAYVTRSGLLWERINNRILGDVKFGVVEGLQKGESMPQIKERVSQLLTKEYLKANGRLDVLVRTEVHTAAELGRVDFFRKTGVERVEWLTAGDDRVRDEHIAREGRIFPLKEAEQLIQEPNCRCTLIPIIEEPGAEAAEVQL